MPLQRNRPAGNFNPAATLPFELRIEDFQMAMQDVYDFFHDVNGHLLERGLQRLEKPTLRLNRLATERP